MCESAIERTAYKILLDHGTQRPNELDRSSVDETNTCDSENVICQQVESRDLLFCGHQPILRTFKPVLVARLLHMSWIYIASNWIKGKTHYKHMENTWSIYTQRTSRLKTRSQFT